MHERVQAIFGGSRRTRLEFHALNLCDAKTMRSMLSKLELSMAGNKQELCQRLHQGIANAQDSTLANLETIYAEGYAKKRWRP